MNDDDTLEILRRLRLENPGLHPYTLSLLLQVETGRQLTGAAVARLLQKAN